MQNPPDEDLMQMVVAADDEAFSEGVEPKGRGFAVLRKVMESLGYNGFAICGSGTPPIVDRISALHRSLYRRSDIGIGGVHGGIFMFRDVFARIHIPLIFGSVAFNPFQHTDLSERQLKWLDSRLHDRQAFLDQFIDIMDFAGGIVPLGNYKAPSAQALQTFWLAGFQLQAAASILSVAFDFRGAVQSALIGTELAIKAGLTAHGHSEKQLRRLGHDLVVAAEKFAERESRFDIARVRAVLKQMPKYVENRYSPKQPSRIETGHIAMGAQYVAGEVMRQITQFSIRDTFSTPLERTYPITGDG